MENKRGKIESWLREHGCYDEFVSNTLTFGSIHGRLNGECHLNRVLDGYFAEETIKMAFVWSKDYWLSLDNEFHKWWNEMEFKEEDSNEDSGM